MSPPRSRSRRLLLAGLMGLLLCGGLAPAAQAAATRWIYWTNLSGASGGTVSRANLDGSGGSVLVTGQNYPRGVAIDEKHGWIFWAVQGDDAIRRARLDGSQVTTLDTTGAPTAEPNAVAVDPDAGRVYWSNATGAQIGFANEDGSGGGGRLTKTGATMTNPQGVAIDVAAGRIYFSDDVNTTNGRIGYLKLDDTGGANLPTTPDGPPGFAEGISVNPGAGRVYWGAFQLGGANAIGTAKTDGSGGGASLDTTGVAVSGPGGTGYDAIGNRVYWTDWAAGAIRFASAAGGGGGTLPVAGSGIQQPWGSPAFTSGATASVAVTPTAGLDFGEQRTGSTSAAQQITLTNSGSVAALLDNLGLTGTDAARFSQTNDCAPTLPAGASCTVTVTFSPAADGAATASLDVDVDGTTVKRPLSGTGVTPVAGLSPSSHDFGKQRVSAGATAPTTFTVKNTGTGTLGLTSLGVGGADASQFAISGGTCTASTTLTAGATCTVQVTFDPGSDGAKTALLDVKTDAGDKSSTLAGTGVTPQLHITPPSEDFGEVRVDGGPSSYAVVTVTNTGTGPLRLDSVGLGGTDAADFTIPGTDCVAGDSLVPGQWCLMSVAFDPSTAGPKSASVVIGSDAGEVTSALTGTGVTPVASLSPSTVQFPQQEVNAELTAPRTLTVTNTGTGSLTVTGISLSGADQGSFALGGGTCAVGSTLAAGASCTVDVTFSPTTAGTKAATLTVSTDAGSPTSTLGGTAVLPPLTVTGITATPRCLGTGPGAGPDVRIGYVLSDAANVTFTLQRRVAPVMRKPRRCPAPLVPSTVPVTYTQVGTAGTSSPAGSGYVTVTQTGLDTGAAPARARRLVRTIRSRAGRTSVSLLRILHLAKPLVAGRYRVVMTAQRAGGGPVAEAHISFWVLQRTR